MHPEIHTPKNSPRTADEDDEGNEGENEGRTAQRQHLPTHWRMRNSHSKKLLNVDDNPDEEDHGAIRIVAGFWSVGALGPLWAAGWFFWFRDSPREMPGISSAEIFPPS